MTLTSLQLVCFYYILTTFTTVGYGETLEISQKDIHSNYKTETAISFSKIFVLLVHNLIL